MCIRDRSFASPVGLLLSCNHIYNQDVLIDNSEETLQKFEKSARNILYKIAAESYQKYCKNGNYYKENRIVYSE